MYVRIARFQGGDHNWDDFAADVRETIRSGGQGTPFERVSDAAQRVMLLVDRDGNRGANLILCETEDDLRQVDISTEVRAPRPAAGVMSFMRSPASS